MNGTSTPNPPAEERTADAAATLLAERADARAPAEVALQPRLALVLDQIGADDARELMREIFAHAARVLAHVKSIRLELEQEGAGGGGVPSLLKEVSVGSRLLLTMVETAELRVESVTDSLRETFDSVAFAMGHEMRRLFAGELGRRGAEGGPRATAGLIVRACGLVENCLQQSVITLAQAFDPAVTSVEIFEDYRERRENSLALRAELGALVENVAAGSREPSVLANVSVLRHVRRFRYEHMHLLMYRDWEQFERFADALEESYESVEAFAGLLHTFSCYLTTLHGQVSLRAVLTDG
ncbi:MAG TPA: hypothetical protein VK421_09620 [Pyrinomonadaceae bacterium]|nr:hypothetical protein [Pyrinomonadaceae bacterium]